MQPNNKADLYKLVADVYAYYRQPVSEFILGVWWNACVSFELEQVRKAMSLHVTNPDGGQFLPKIADLVKALRGTSTDRAAIAWGKVYEAMGSVGAYTDVVFDEGAIHSVVEDLGGWPKLCRTEIKELGFIQHRFLEAYKAYTKQGGLPYPSRLMGDRSPDHEYARFNRPLPAPAFVGDLAAAKQVFNSGSTKGKTSITFPLRELSGRLTSS